MPPQAMRASLTVAGAAAGAGAGAAGFAGCAGAACTGEAMSAAHTASARMSLSGMSPLSFGAEARNASTRLGDIAARVSSRRAVRKPSLPVGAGIHPVAESEADAWAGALRLGHAVLEVALRLAAGGQEIAAAEQQPHRRSSDPLAQGELGRLAPPDQRHHRLRDAAVDAVAVPGHTVLA